MKKSLVIIDMVHGFINEGALSDQSINRITPNIVALTEKFIASNQTILNFQDAHEEDANEFTAFPPHCLKGSHESELIDELMPYKEKMITLYKNSTNGFMHPDFLTTFHAIDADEYVCVGCCTDICVLQFALSLQGYINEHNLKKRVVVVKDSVETFGMTGHEQAQFNEISLTLMRNAGIKIVDTAEEVIHDI